MMKFVNLPKAPVFSILNVIVCLVVILVFQTAEAKLKCDLRYASNIDSVTLEFVLPKPVDICNVKRQRVQLKGLPELYVSLNRADCFPETMRSTVQTWVRIEIQSSKQIFTPIAGMPLSVNGMGEMLFSVAEKPLLIFCK